ncbi:MAG: hypothetical protein ACJAXT_000472 [Paracoccaceae bacterium]|jgi:hypothetical protein
MAASEYQCWQPDLDHFGSYAARRHGVLGIEINAIGVVFLCGTAVWKLFKRSHD